MKTSTIISNKIYIKNASPELYMWCRDNLVVNNPKWETLKKLGKDQQISRYHIEQKMNLYVSNGLDLIIPFGCLHAIWPMIKNNDYTIEFNELPPISCINDKIKKPLYDYQEKAVSAMVSAKGGFLKAPCASGKTSCAIEIIHRLGKKFLWLTHTKDLVKQSYERFKQLYPNMKIGIISDGKVNFGEDGTIATIQTMANLDPEIYKNNFEIVMTDECHLISGSPTIQKMFVRVIEKIPARYKYGISATDGRNDSLTKSIYTTVGCNLQGEFLPVYVIQKSETNTLIAEHLKIELDTPFSYCMLKEDGTFDYSALIDYISTYEPRNDFIVEKIVELQKENRKQLVLCNRKEQCEIIHNKLMEKNIKSSLLMGNVSDKKRSEILNQKTDWDVIVATTSLAKVGLDVTILDTLHLASCIGNKSDTEQSAGRIERVCEGKNPPIIYDYVDINIPYLVSKYKKRVSWLKRRK